MIAFDILEEKKKWRKFGGVGWSLSRFETEACFFQKFAGFAERLMNSDEDESPSSRTDLIELKPSKYTDCLALCYLSEDIII